MSSHPSHPAGAGSEPPYTRVWLKWRHVSGVDNSSLPWVIQQRWELAFQTRWWWRAWSVTLSFTVQDKNRTWSLVG